MKKRWLILLPFLLSFVVLLSGCEAQLTAAPTPSPTPVALAPLMWKWKGTSPPFFRRSSQPRLSNLTARWILWDGVVWRLPAWERT